jgi:hypothetical protein
MLFIEKTVSGRQTGADRARLDSAIEYGFPHGVSAPAYSSDWTQVSILQVPNGYSEGGINDVRVSPELDMQRPERSNVLSVLGL